MSFSTVLYYTRTQAVPGIVEAILGICDDRILPDMGLVRDAGNRLVPAPHDDDTAWRLPKAA